MQWEDGPKQIIKWLIQELKSRFFQEPTFKRQNSQNFALLDDFEIGSQKTENFHCLKIIQIEVWK